jgi:hypothetical protein
LKPKKRLVTLLKKKLRTAKNYKKSKDEKLKNNIEFTNEEVSYLLSADAVRDRAGEIFEMTLEGQTNFNYHAEKLEETVLFVEKVVKENYPDLNIPFHSRWGHFRVGDIRRDELLEQEIADKKELCRAKLDLVITSVLLDAGAGAAWSYSEESSGQSIARSEGLAVASYYLFKDGGFSSDKQKSLIADAAGLKSFTSKDLAKAFQVSDDNPLVGLDGRVHLLNKLGEIVESKKDIFPNGRLGEIYDYLEGKYSGSVLASDLLEEVLNVFGGIWPGRISLGEVSLGDVWQHSKLGSSNSTDSLVPFHKLSQWLTYSMMEPLMEAGLAVNELGGMTGLPEYRNGGLLLDIGLISLKDSSEASKGQQPDSDLIIEWRALTVHCLDLIADLLREKLELSAEEFPLVKALEGGTWWAGRRIAKEKRNDGTPPLNIISDGTVF